MLHISRNGTELLMKDPFWNGTQNGTQHYPAKPFIELPKWTDCSDRLDGNFKRSKHFLVLEIRNCELWILELLQLECNNAFMITFHSSNLYRDYLKKIALPQLDKLHNKTSNTTDSLEKIYDKWNTDDQDHGNCTYGSGMNQVQNFRDKMLLTSGTCSWKHSFKL